MNAVGGDDDSPLDMSLIAKVSTQIRGMGPGTAQYTRFQDAFTRLMRGTKSFRYSPSKLTAAASAERDQAEQGLVDARKNRWVKDWQTVPGTGGEVEATEEWDTEEWNEMAYSMGEMLIAATIDYTKKCAVDMRMPNNTSLQRYLHSRQDDYWRAGHYLSRNQDAMYKQYCRTAVRDDQTPSWRKQAWLAAMVTDTLKGTSRRTAREAL